MSNQVKELMWSDLPIPWKICLEESWLAYQNGSVPIGAVITNSNGDIIAQARNRIHETTYYDKQVNLNQLAHAELNVLLKIDQNTKDVHSLSIYTSLEPCPLCMGAIYMSGIRNVFFAAWDPYAGSVNMIGKTPYLSVKPMKIHSPHSPLLESIIIALQTEYLLQHIHHKVNDSVNPVIQKWQEVYPKPVKIGHQLYQNNWVQTASREIMNPSEFFDKMANFVSQENI